MYRRRSRCRIGRAGRGLAVFLTFIFGATTAGSAVWGKLSAMDGLPVAYFVAATGVVLAIPMTWPFWFATRAERGDSPVPSMVQPSGATVVSIDGPRIAALAQFFL